MLKIVKLSHLVFPTTQIFYNILIKKQNILNLFPEVEQEIVSFVLSVSSHVRECKDTK